MSAHRRCSSTPATTIQASTPDPPNGEPTRGIRALDVDEADCKKLTHQDVHQLFKAADALVRTEERGNAAPRRNRAILEVLY